MFFALLTQVVSFLLNVLALHWRSLREKNLEILLLHHQLAILQRTLTTYCRFYNEWRPHPGLG